MSSVWARVAVALMALAVPVPEATLEARAALEKAAAGLKFFSPHGTLYNVMPPEMAAEHRKALGSCRAARRLR